MTGARYQKSKFSSERKRVMSKERYFVHNSFLAFLYHLVFGVSDYAAYTVLGYETIHL